EGGEGEAPPLRGRAAAPQPRDARGAAQADAAGRRQAGPLPGGGLEGRRDRDGERLDPPGAPDPEDAGPVLGEDPGRPVARTEGDPVGPLGAGADDRPRRHEERAPRRGEPGPGLGPQDDRSRVPGAARPWSILNRPLNRAPRPVIIPVLFAATRGATTRF